MKDHPLTPMRDSNLVRVLQRQMQHKVGLVPHVTVARGADAIDDAFRAARGRGERVVVCDAISDANLYEIGRAAAEMPLITGGSGVALGLPSNFIRKGLMTASEPQVRMPAAAGRSAILAGSCSEATRGQVAAAIKAGMPALKVDPEAVARGATTARDVMTWVAGQSAAKPVLIYSSADPNQVQSVQERLGRDRAGALVEGLLAAVATALVAAGVTRLLVAGGETAGAVVGGLGIAALEIGPEIDPGVPWTKAKGRAADGRDLVLALKSGNFGAVDFFTKAWTKLT